MYNVKLQAVSSTRTRGREVNDPSAESNTFLVNTEVMIALPEFNLGKYCEFH